MKMGLALLANECRVVLRYRIVLAALFVLAGYAVILGFGVGRVANDVTTFLIFSDPSMLGLAFAGLLVMLEREQGADFQVFLAGVGRLQRFASRALVIGGIAVLLSAALAVFFARVEHWPAFLLTSYAISITYSALGMAIALRIRRITAFFAVAGICVLSIYLNMALALGFGPIGALWPFQTQFEALRSALGAGSAQEPAVLGATLLSLLYAVLALWASANLGGRRLSPA
ncbi:hypothetical protein Ga0102493_111328 [Erythrobacter litoralis]|uniref:Uncharacterized protein n=1 Tax=Erythrobacter litoralis TaxID=39960 RepID=A0A074MCT1_9SPHN|nr:hypothetical protein [Erythrobacter litoralis]AOL22355.1 hypothetical protein Ga0102493_111328 [Erythrobacter litoralis]KEO89643.1 hypothetical protein EH32_03835 [Erythrobacter litoralis]